MEGLAKGKEWSVDNEEGSGMESGGAGFVKLGVECSVESRECGVESVWNGKWRVVTGEREKGSGELS